MNFLLDLLIQRILVNWRSTVRALVIALAGWLASKGITLSDGTTEQLVGWALTGGLILQQLFAKDKPGEKSLISRIRGLFSKDKNMKISLLLFFLFLSVPALAQDRVKISASFANSDLALDDIQGVQGEVDVRIAKGEKLRLGGVFHYVRPYFDYTPAQGRQVDTYSAGPSLSYDAFGGRVSLFGRALFGATTDYAGSHAFTRTYGGGIDVNVGAHFFIRPGVIDFIRTEGIPITINRYGAGAGVRF